MARVARPIRRRNRSVVAVVIAIAIHLVAGSSMVGLPIRVWPVLPHTAIELTVFDAPPPPPPLSPTEPPEVLPVIAEQAEVLPKARERRPIAAAAEPSEPVSATPPVAVVEPTTATPPPQSPASTDAPSWMRGPTGTMADVMGVGMPTFGPTAKTLERSLDLGVSGPRSDAQRAAQGALENLQQDISDDAVTAGLADDYFRLLRLQIERTWLPAKNELNDGGASASQVGLSKAFATDMSAWLEVWSAYMDVAKQYANGVQPQLPPKRRERLMELMRSRKGMFRIQAISEFLLTQSSDGRMQLLETKVGSGHPRIDDSMTTAIAAAVKALPDPPPPRMTHGRSFSSTWRLRATWQMVPPTAFFSGTGFDITSKGIEVDVPFDIKLTTNVLLLRTDARTTPAAGTSDPSP